MGFGSCLHQRKPQPIWRAIIAAQPQLFLMKGDNLYDDVKSAPMSELHAAYRAPAQNPYFLYEVTSSALNMPIGGRKSDEPATLRVGAIYTWENFGLITIDWEARRIELSLRDRDGRPVRKVVVPMAQLGLGGEL